MKSQFKKLFIDRDIGGQKFDFQANLNYLRNNLWPHIVCKSCYFPVTSGL